MIKQDHGEIEDNKFRFVSDDDDIIPFWSLVHAMFSFDMLKSMINDQ